MKDSRKYIHNLLAIVLLLFFVFPIGAKTVHALTSHHKHFECKAENENHFHSQHKDCPICKYQFTQVLLPVIDIPEKITEPVQAFEICFCQDIYQKEVLKRFLCRAPPCILFSI